MDAGMSCPDAPLCLGQWVPPLVNPLITTHFLHRVLGVLVAIAVLSLGAWALRSDLPSSLKRWAAAAAMLVLVQVGLGFTSVLTVLAVVPVSLHTLVAAMLIVALLHLATAGRIASNARGVVSVPSPTHSS